MTKILEPTLDYVFKKLFVTKINLLTDLINSVLFISEDNIIKKVEIKNPEILPDHITEKYIILDIYAVDNNGNQYDIEMQAVKYKYYPKRSIFYLCKMFSNQLNSGQNYDLLEPTIGIHFLNYIEYKEYQKKFHFCFEFRERKHPELLYTDDVSLHIFELPKILTGKKYSNKLKQKQYEWLDFIKNANKGRDYMLKAQYLNPLIYEAFDQLTKISSDNKIRTEAELREKALKNKNSELYAAKEEGKNEGRKEGEISNTIQMIEKLINSGSQWQFIEQVLGYNKYSFDQLKKEYNAFKKNMSRNNFNVE